MQRTVELSIRSAHCCLFYFNRAFHVLFSPQSYLRCRASLDCPGFIINYDSETCFKLDSNSDDIRKDLVPASGKVNYFQKLCLQGMDKNARYSLSTILKLLSFSSRSLRQSVDLRARDRLRACGLRQWDRLQRSQPLGVRRTLPGGCGAALQVSRVWLHQQGVQALYREETVATFGIQVETKLLLPK